ncbi:hypothetical protein BJ742DRAFT_184580 [Cladochytrium replicatum]|nr:hypothetical protein BJ742DRAFT_184580 [Cladochytrium replicatum]
MHSYPTEFTQTSSTSRMGSPAWEPENQPMPVFWCQLMEFISKIGQIVLRARVGLPSHRDAPTHHQHLYLHSPASNVASAASTDQRGGQISTDPSRQAHGGYGALDSARDDVRTAGAMSSGTPHRTKQSSPLHEQLSPSTPGPAVAPHSPSSNVPIQFSALLDRQDFWRNGMPLNLDIFMPSTRTLVERWVVSYEPSDRMPTSEYTDVTDLILLVQSLYSYVRLMPIHSSLSDGVIAKSDLGHCLSTADGFVLSSPADECETYADDDDPNLHASPAFDLSARLKVYKFRTAMTSFGKLHLSVVFDVNLSSILPQTKTQTKQQVIPVSIEADSTPILVTPSKPPLPSSTPRPSLGSPFPSPTLQRRALSIAQLKLTPTPTPPPAAPISTTRSTPRLHHQPPTPTPFVSTTTASTAPSVPQFTPSPSPRPSSRLLFSSLSFDNDEEEDEDVGMVLAMPVPIPSLENTVVAAALEKDVGMLGVTPGTPPGSRRTTPGTTPSTPGSHRSSRFEISWPFKGGHELAVGRRDSMSAAELFGSLVGSYEVTVDFPKTRCFIAKPGFVYHKESILSGRMSTLPSKPISFISEIGVIGIGKCKPGLKCPPHLHLAFPAYFYELPDDESPATPYVGSIDLENLGGLIVAEGESEEEAKRGWVGGYRIPHRGQLQIVIKNPSKTAVKVFLVPYDFRDMPASTKTFLRQKSYAVSPTTMHTTPSAPPLATSSSSSSPPSKPGSANPERMRYAIHLQFHSTARKRLYLAKSLRVVFSHRAPDTDERLRIVMEGPKEPKYMSAEGGLCGESSGGARMPSF